MTPNPTSSVKGVLATDNLPNLNVILKDDTSLSLNINTTYQNRFADTGDSLA